MKTLVLVGVLALGLSFPLTSQAEVSAFGVTLPLEEKEVSDSHRGGYVASNFSDSLNVQKLHNVGVKEAKEKEVYENVYSAFGINISGDQVI